MSVSSTQSAAKARLRRGADIALGLRRSGSWFYGDVQDSVRYDDEGVLHLEIVSGEDYAAPGGP